MIFTEATAHWYSINMGQIESAYTSTTEIMFLFKEQNVAHQENELMVSVEYIFQQLS